MNLLFSKKSLRKTLKRMNLLYSTCVLFVVLLSSTEESMSNGMIRFKNDPKNLIFLRKGSRSSIGRAADSSPVDCWFESNREHTIRIRKGVPHVIDSFSRVVQRRY